VLLSKSVTDRPRLGPRKRSKGEDSVRSGSIGAGVFSAERFNEALPAIRVFILAYTIQAGTLLLFQI